MNNLESFKRLIAKKGFHEAVRILFSSELSDDEKVDFCNEMNPYRDNFITRVSCLV